MATQRDAASDDGVICIALAIIILLLWLVAASF